MIQLPKVIARTEALLGEQGAALTSRQIKALAQALVEEINRQAPDHELSARIDQLTAELGDKNDELDTALHARDRLEADLERTHKVISGLVDSTLQVVGGWVCPCGSEVVPPPPGEAHVCKACGMMLTRNNSGRLVRSIFDDLDQ